VQYLLEGTVNKTIVTLLSAVLAFAILSPIKEGWRGIRGDSFPMSWYPMFSRPRGELEKITYMVGMLPDGSRRIIRSGYFVRGPMNQARQHVQKYGRSSSKSMAMCETAAGRMAERMRGPKSRMVQVRLLRGSFSREGYFAEGRKLPAFDVVKAACDVPGRSTIDKPRRGTVLRYDDETGEVK
jgi:hypothetical protein